MSIFGDLFQDEESEGSPVEFGPSNICGESSVPYPPRQSVGLCGIYNQGATCYMNSLLQTLLYTPEFRESLFSLGPDVLGRLENADKPHAKVRVIPIQLQRLFARLLLLNQQGATTTDLTDSFGWTNNEELQQHDAQELNRILFSAIEDSLVGTSGQNLIRDLYHGTVVNQIICQECGKVSEREEDFLDISVAIAAGSGLQYVLRNNYVEMESLSGNNQYKCEACERLVDAKKGAKLRHLPPVLTLSLLRFSFDFVKLERFKETGKFSFPIHLDMSPYCENLLSGCDTEYELFSVVIHRGGAHGGHYFAYIRDIDSLGTWTHPEEEQIKLPPDPSSGKVDYIEFDSPIELIYSILKQAGSVGLQIDKLCVELAKQTGVSWNRRFKKQWGPICKFLARHDDKFIFDPYTTSVAAKIPGKMPATAATSQGKGPPEGKSEDGKNISRPNSPPPECGKAWFQFDDSRVHPIRVKDIEKQFSGKESAYMLFYRKMSWSRPGDARTNSAYGVPEWLISEVMEENCKLQANREEYESRVNTISVQLYISSLMKFDRGALQACSDMCPYIEMSFDQRKTVSEFKNEVREMCGELITSDYVMHIAKDLPAGLHLYSEITEPDECTVKDTLIGNGSKLFIWNGQQINGEEVPIGEDFEPVLLKVTHGNPSHFSQAFPKNTTIAALCSYISTVSSIPMESMTLTRLISKATESKAIKVSPDDMKRTLEELEISNGDHFVAEDKRNESSSFTENTIKKHSSLISFVIENRYIKSEEEEFMVIPVEVEKEVSVAELKTVVISQLKLLDIPEGGRLRVDDDNFGLRPPLHELQSLESAGLKQGMRLVLEPGPAPEDTQITLTFTPGEPSSDKSDLEVIVDMKVTVQDCVTLMRNKADLEGTDWYLRKTNWCGEAAEVLNDVDLTLDQCGLRNGDHLLLVAGVLPPKGFIKVTAWLYESPYPTAQSGSIMASITSGIASLLGVNKETVEESEFPVNLGDLVISKEATLEDFKLQIQTLQLMREVTLPTSNFMRLRLIESKRLTAVLRGSTQTLQRLKVTNGGHVGVQVLQEEENLSGGQIVLQVRQRVPDSTTYLPAQELVWDSSRYGTSPFSLRQCIAELLQQSVEQTLIAKHLPEKYEWMIIRVNQEQKLGKRGSKGGKKKTIGKTNIKQAPFHIKDGDTIGVKNTTYDKTDDFASEADIEGLKRLAEEAVEKKRRREEMKKLSSNMLDTENSSRRTPEVGIKIHVGDFR